VIYQIYPRSFFDSNGDGIGDLPGVTAKLDHVARLGVDAIWLCPFFTSPQKDFGYDVADHTAVDPLFGTLADFDALVARAHALGLRVLIDQVWSHTSDHHAWFRESRTNRTNILANWYVWADPALDGTPPNNWLSVFGGPAWKWEPRRRQYYLHHFLTQQPALNLHNPAVMEALLAGGEFWLQRGVDGFRLDAIDFLLHDPALRSNPPAPGPAEIPAKLFGMQLHQHDMLQPDTLDLLTRIRGLMDRYPKTVTMGEVSSQAGDQRLHMAYTLRPLRGAFDWPTVNAMVHELAHSGEAGWPCWSFSNHDVERAISRWNPRRGDAYPEPTFARLLMALLLSLRGSVSLYQGEELGLTEAELGPEHLRDPFGIEFWPEFRGRDGSRTPMPWQGDAPHGGFTTAPEPWLPVPERHRALAVDRHEQDGTGLLHVFRRFLAWRHSHPAMTQGAVEPLAMRQPLIGFTRELNNERILALFNISDQPAHVELSTFPGLRPMPECGFSTELWEGVARLPPYGAFFAAIEPAGAASPARELASVT